MTPYYDEDGITIYHGNCADVLRGLQADVVITDPPYGTGHYETDTAIFDEFFLAELVTGYRGVAVFGWPENLVGLCVGAGLTPTEWVTWAPTNGGVRGFNPSGLLRETEHIAIWNGHWTELTDGVVSKSVTKDYQNSLTRGGHKDQREGRRLGDVWTEAAPGLGFNHHKRLHPNEKPLSIMQRLVGGLTAPGETVIDPFMGSGSTVRAAKDLGRKAIGIEIVEEYCEIAVKRLAQGVLDFGESA